MPHLRLQLAGLVAAAVLALTGCQVVSTPASSAQVRFIQVSADAPAVDLYQGSSALLYSVGLGTASSYFPTQPGSYTYSVNGNRVRQQLASAATTFAAGSQYTVLVGDTTASLQMTVLKDQALPTPAGQVAVRFLHQATRVGAVDLYLVPPNSTLATATPIAADVAFGNAPAYLHIPSGTFSLAVLPAGASPASSRIPLYTGTQSAYKPGSARTVVLYDRSADAGPVDEPGLEVLTVPDFEPAE